MKLTSTISLLHHPKYILVYGPSGLGKTTLAKTVPNKKRVLMLDAERGTGSLNGEDISCVVLSRGDDGRLLNDTERFDKLQEFVTYVQTDECKAQFDILFLDSLTEIGEIVLKHFQSKMDGFKMWGEFKDSIKGLLKFFRDLDHYTIICTALETREKEDGEELGPYLPKVGNKTVREELPQFFDLVTRLVLDAEGNRRLLCKPTAKSYAKDRYGHLGLTEEPNLALLMQKTKQE